MQNAYPTPTPHNICGPFDRQFTRKFRGRQQRSLSHQHIKLAQPPSSLPSERRGESASLPSILPKLKEIEKLAKSERRKPQKSNKYVDGVSELQLYLAKKLVSNLTTQQIVSKIMQNNSLGFENRKIVTENYLRMTTPHSTHTKFHQLGAQSLETSIPEGRFVQTEYSPSKKWVTDKEFVQKFGQFIVKKHEQEPAADEENEHTAALSEQQAVRQIRSDKQVITRIAKQMIAEQGRDSEEEETRQARESSVEGSSGGQLRGIEWILRECGQWMGGHKGKLKCRK